MFVVGDFSHPSSVAPWFGSKSIGFLVSVATAMSQVEPT